MAETEARLELEIPPEAGEKSESSEGSEGDDTTEGKAKQQKKDVIFAEEGDEEEEKDDVSLNLLERNTSSFQCLAQIAMSSSSLMNQRMRFFPPIPDPGLDDALSYLPPDPVFDNTGSEKYRLVCKEHNIVPISRVLKSLGTQELDLKYYGLTKKQIEAITQALMLNAQVQRLILQDNWLSTESAFLISEMLTENNTIEYLNLMECRIGPEGAANLNEGIMTNQCLREIDLSFNNLGDEGIRKLQKGLLENASIRSINLSHNHLGDGACEVLAKILTENHSIEELDLSWNNIFSTPGLKTLSVGLRASTSLKNLNLAWNTITVKPAVRWILRYMKASTILEQLDLSNNRLAGAPIRMIRAGVLNCPSLKSIKIGNNTMTPDEAMLFLQLFIAKPKNALTVMDLENVFVNKDFIPIMRRLKARGKVIRIGGVLKNYEIRGPDINRLLFERAKYLGMKPKQKKRKRDFGHFVLMLPEENVTKQQFQDIFKKNKMKMLDENFRKELMDRFPYKKNKISLPDLKQDYLRRYPDTALPPPKKKKGKKGKKGKKKKKGADKPAEAPQAEEAATKPTDEVPLQAEAATQPTDEAKAEEAAPEQADGVKPTETVEEAQAEGTTAVNPDEAQATTAESESKETENDAQMPQDQDGVTEQQNIVTENADVNPEP